MMQETWRLAFVARGSPANALVNDLVWGLLLVPALVWAVRFDSATAEVFVLAWGVAGTLAGLVGMIQAGFMPQPGDVVAWARDHWDLSWRQLGEFAAQSGSNQSVMYAAAAVAGLAAAGALRAGQVLLGPLQTVYQAAWFVGLSEFVRLLRRRPQSFIVVSVWLSILMGVGGLTYGALFLLYGSTFGPILLGDTWANAQPLMIPLTISFSTIGFGLGPNVGLRAIQALSRSLHARLTVAALTFISGIIGAFLWGAEGAAWGLATAGVLGVGIWWWQFHLGVRANIIPVVTEPTSDDLLVDRTQDV